MSDITNNTPSMDKFRELLDWTIFSLGVLSLTFALGATVASKTQLFTADQADVPVVEVLAG